jgi:hypothetical protein
MRLSETLLIFTVATAMVACSEDKPARSGPGEEQGQDDEGDDEGDQDDDDEAPACTSYLGVDDGCDCGCGEDADCGGNGCTEPGCDTLSCQYCYDADGEAITCLHKQPPAEWTCNAAYFDDTFDDCDCGCGAMDPDCADAGCSEASCDTPACDYCYGAGGEVITCAKDMPPEGWTCGQDAYRDGAQCDCGCGAADPDCAEAGCTEPGCDADACWICHDPTGAVITCTKSIPPEGWSCNPAYYNEPFDDCDCGCGVPDPDCAGAGCFEASCTDATCDYCYDADGADIGCGPTEG